MLGGVLCISQDFLFPFFPVFSFFPVPQNYIIWVDLSLNVLILSSVFSCLVLNSSSEFWGFPGSWAFQVSSGERIHLLWRRYRQTWFPFIRKIPLEEGIGNPLQYCCLENPMDRVAWWATVHRIPKSWTWLKRENMHTSEFFVSIILILNSILSLFYSIYFHKYIYHIHICKIMICISI